MSRNDEAARPEAVPVAPGSIIAGDLLRLHFDVRVEAVLSPDGTRLSVRDLDAPEDADPFEVDGERLIARSSHATYVDRSERVTRTRMAELLSGAGRQLFEATYTTADGRERVLRGRLLAPEPLMGRSHVEDLELPAGDRIRQVDHRTLRSLVLGGVRYTLR